ncbi:unnamed protein product [Cuscuta europaea]|uniref:HAT C-terminal dimerisation domain-containing protein n=1 Tax=Cuscuta europaea TaxID=41803 RepID=A0A9P0YXV4_CUSEU|nr:unnamed protein product [Cuscuta europaea]
MANSTFSGIPITSPLPMSPPSSLSILMLRSMSLDKFVIKTKRSLIGGVSSSIVPNQSISSVENATASNENIARDERNERDKRARTESTHEWDIISDPFLRKSINEYAPGIRDDVMKHMELKEQLQVWIYEMSGNEAFSTLQSIGEVSKKMVELTIHKSFHLVYRLIELALVLPVSTATDERAFSSMNIIKTDLRNKMGDDYLTDCLVCYIERDIFQAIDNEAIMQHFQNMKTRRIDLPRLQK